MESNADRKGELSARPGVLLDMRALLPLLFCVALTLGAAPAAPATRPALDRQCQDLLAKWQASFDQEGLSYLVAPPFVIAGDGGGQRLQDYLDGTIRASAEAMQRQFFDKQPTEPILILLFESERPYRRLAKEWFGDENVTRFGYFRRDNVMLMNVGTGTGTLVHELTHALIYPDFPDVPDWFNEGLGSLFEQCTLAGGKIRGLTNWRLAALQRAIRQEQLRPLSELIQDTKFYGESNVGLNYAQARYLLMYFQEKGALETFYRSLRATISDDPTGYVAFRQTIAPQSLDEFERQWRQWVLKLTFP